jgi:acetyl esterase/lipase
MTVPYQILRAAATVAITISTVAASYAQRDEAAARLDAAIELKRDIAYADTEHDRQRLDLYLPKVRKTDAALPVIAYIHGGAWMGGDKRGGADALGPFVASGEYAAVSIGYRLSQHARWPAQIHDCKSAIRWIRGHAKEYNLDPDKIGVLGGSAGGHLVAMLGTSGDRKDLEGDLGGHDDQSSHVTCVVDYFGPSDFLTIADYPSQLDHAAADSPEARLIGGRIQDMQDVARNVSPVTHVSRDDPPFLIVHGTNDQIVPYNQSQRLRDALREAGVEVALVSIEGGGHGGFESEALDDRVRKFFDKHLRGQEAEFADETLK